MLQGVCASVVISILSFAQVAVAQPQFDVFGGGQFAYRPPEPTARDWVMTGGYRISERFDYVVEIAWHQRRDLISSRCSAPTPSSGKAW